MYKNVESIIFTKKMRKKDIARVLGISYQTLLYKLSGKFPFTLDEAFRLKRILKTDIPMDKLFEKDGEISGKQG